MYGAAILAAAGLVVKILGAVFRIPLGNLIGDEGMGYYNAAYPVYTLLIVIGATGLPVAVSRLVAEHHADNDPVGAERVFKIAFWLVAVISVCFFCILYFGAGAITSRMAELSAASYAMQALAPAMIFVPIMAVFRGYFQGTQNMKPTAVSQIIEQIFRVVVGIALAYFLIRQGTAMAAAGGTFGATAGAIAGLIVLLVLFYRTHGKALPRERRERRELKRLADADPRRETTGKIIKQIAVIALPITIGAMIMPIMYNIDAFMVPFRLSEAGFSPVDVRSMYGQLSGFAEPLTNLPKVLTQAIAISMVPTVVRAWKARDREFLSYNVSLGFRFALLIGLPCTVGMMVLSQPVMFLLYPFQLSGAAGAAPALFIFAIGIVFLCSIDALTSALQGVGKQMIPFLNIAIGAGCKCVVTYTLTGLPSFNIKGAAMGTVTAYAVAMILNYRAVRKYTGTRFQPGLTFVRPIISALVMGGAAAAVYYSVHGAIAGANGSLSGLAQFASAQLHKTYSVTILSNAVATVLAILVAIIVYIVMLFVTRSIRPDELKLLPKGEKLYGMYRKITRRKV